MTRQQDAHPGTPRRDITSKGSFGFSMPEILAVVGIAGVLTAIAIPLTIGQQAKAANETTQGNLKSVSSAMNASLQSLRGIPPEALNVCSNAATWPTSGTVTNTCANGTWTATRVSNNASVSPTIEGKVSPSVQVQGRIAADGSYCLDGTSTQSGSSAFHITSLESEVVAGTCQSVGWTSNGGVSGSAGISGSGSLSAAPTGLTATPNPTAGNVSVQWTAVSGAAYSVEITGYAPKTITATAAGALTCIFPSDTCAASLVSGSLPKGDYIASVRQVNTDGAGPAAVVSFTVTVTATATAAGTLDMSTVSVTAPVATVADVRTNRVTNPSLETSTNVWTGGGCSGTDLTRTAAIPAYSGSYSGVATALSACNSRAYYSTDSGGHLAPVTAGSTYTFSIYSRTAVTPRPFDLLLEWMDTAGAYISYAETTEVTDTTTGWTRLTITATAPAGIAYVQPSIRWQGVAAGEVHYFDGALLELSGTANSYFDGSTAGAGWTGTANASTSVKGITGIDRGRAHISWSQPPAAAGQRVMYTVVSSPDSNTCQVVSATSCYITGLQDDTTYTFTVTATNLGGTGSAGVSNAVKTPPAPATAATLPGVPLNVTASPTAGGKITLSWSGPTDRGDSAISDYIIETQSGSVWTPVADGTSSTTSYVVASGLTPGQTYIYRVSAVNGTGQGPTSDPVSTQPGFPPVTPTIVTQPQYTLSTGNTTMSIVPVPATASGTVTYVTGYSTSGTITNPANLPAGTAATQSCPGTCVFTWANSTGLLGTKYYFYVFPVNTVGYGSPAIGEVAAPDASAALYAIASSAKVCPPDALTDLGNGNCRGTTPYTYTTSTGTRWAHIGWNYYWGCSCGGTCGNWSNGDPYCRTAQWGWENYSVTTLNAAPSGYLDNGTAWYKDVAKIDKATYKMTTNLPWSDANLITLRLGQYYVRGALVPTGTTADLGLCPGAITYELWGLGGKTTGSVTPPCNS